MNVRLLAFTQFAPGVIDGSSEGPGIPMDLPTNAGPDDLHEFAGRNCYLSFHKPNPKTASTADYLNNIIRSGHWSVLEHASFTFHVTGVSRSLLLELERHRHISLSVVSQRYVGPNQHGLGYVEPPAFADSPSAHRFRLMQKEAWRRAIADYDDCFTILRAEGLDYKSAREAARAFLPGSAETRFVATANLTHWRHVLRMREAPGADREIREFAGRIREHLERHALYSMQV